MGKKRESRRGYMGGEGDKYGKVEEDIWEGKGINMKK